MEYHIVSTDKIGWSLEIIEIAKKSAALLPPGDYCSIEGMEEKWHQWM